MVASLESLFPGGIASAFSGLTACVMLVFSLLYTPCVAAVASVRRELGRKYALGVLFGQCALAWLVCLAVNLVGSALGL